eukprot:7382930-Prymnesium_polylepis.1
MPAGNVAPSTLWRAAVGIVIEGTSRSSIFNLMGAISFGMYSGKNVPTLAPKLPESLAAAHAASIAAKERGPE